MADRIETRSLQVFYLCPVDRSCSFREGECERGLGKTEGEQRVSDREGKGEWEKARKTRNWKMKQEGEIYKRANPPTEEFD
ncbi:hypothetical protein TIFTF001_031028 [Ficus carica]|uniref:Uncharacterized protein n=1 Tax=Ficus carica TaxID=3494 RepID=A0AA88J4K8_FICCA|nr:hypothetical protein TIFTF001_031028 [Ficus carica]